MKILDARTLGLEGIAMKRQSAVLANGGEDEVVSRDIGDGDGRWLRGARRHLLRRQAGDHRHEQQDQESACKDDP